MGRRLTVLTQTGALRASWALTVVLVASFVAAGLSIAYAAHEVRQSDRQWCDLFRALDQPVPSVPALSARQRAIAAKIHAQRLRLGC